MIDSTTLEYFGMIMVVGLSFVTVIFDIVIIVIVIQYLVLLVWLPL